MKKLSKNKWKIPLYKVNNDVREIEAISKVIKRGMDWAIGSEIEHFEQNLAKYIGTKYCLGVNSGTDALKLSIKMLGLGKDDEILVQGNTFIGSISGASELGCKIKLIDIVPETFMIDVNKIEENNNYGWPYKTFGTDYGKKI